jgi:signal-transduction protein with cAMP-binding, CBS, and nucleotidyltransferase domain
LVRFPIGQRSWVPGSGFAGPGMTTVALSIREACTNKGFRGATFSPIFRLSLRLPQIATGDGRRANAREFPMNVETILRNKGNWVATIRPDATVAAAVDLLNRERIGAIVVSEDGEAVDGILSERDIVIALAEHGEDLLSRPVDQIMTRTVITCDPADSVGALMAEMTNRRIRHFPVVAGGRLCGIVSIGDLVKSRLDEVEFEANSLRSFIAGA